MHPFSHFTSWAPFDSSFLFAFLPLLIIAAIWTVILKGFALWYSARAEQKGWFIALLIINTLGILELVYLIWFRPESSKKHGSHTPAHHSEAQA